MMEITTPTFGRLQDYVGVWAMEPRAAAMLYERMRSIDLKSHVPQTLDSPPKVKSQIGIVQSSSGQNVAVLMLTGPLMKALSSADESGTSTIQLRRDIRKAANDPNVSAIVLAIDSPGGTVAGTADLAAEVVSAKQKKPVMAFIDDLGASAAYWIASQADAIYANNETALVGSIGTYSVVYDTSERAKQEGIKTMVFATGPLKGAGTPGMEVTEEQQAYFQKIVDTMQASFDAAVKNGRDYDDDDLMEAKTGGAFMASQAVEMGLIDGISSFESVVEKAVSRQKQKPQIRVENPVLKRSAEMAEEINGAGAVATDPVVSIREKVASEHARIASIEEKAKGYPKVIAQAIAEGWTPEKAELTALKASLPNVVPAAIVRNRDSETTAECLAAAVMARANIRMDSPVFNKYEARQSNLPSWLTSDINSEARDRMMNIGHKYRSMSLIDICRESILRDGKEIPLDRADIVKAAVSGGTLTSIFTTSVNAAMIASYLQAPDTTESWTQTEDVADFKLNERIRLETMGGTMKKLPRGGEADHANRADKLESYQVARYAEQFTIDEQDIIDDSMNSLANTPAEMALKAARLRPDLVYSILLGNPLLNATGRQLFNATEDNTQSSVALNSGNLRTQISKMMLVRENAVNLNLMPTHLIVPPSLLFTARELLNSSQIVIAGTAGTVTERGNANVLSGIGLTIVSDARLENGCVNPDSGANNSGSATTYYLASTMANTIMVGYRGSRVPTVRTYTYEKGKYGIGYDIMLDIGAKAMDWRGMRRALA